MPPSFLVFYAYIDISYSLFSLSQRIAELLYIYSHLRYKLLEICLVYI